MNARILKFLLICLSLMLTTAGSVHAQQKLQPHELQEMWAKVRKPMADTARIKLYIRMGESYSYDPFPEMDSALYYNGLARKLSQRINFQWGLAYCDANDADIYRLTGDHDKGLEMILRVKERCEKHNLPVLLIEAYLTMGFYFHDDFKDTDYLELAIQTSNAKGYKVEEQRALIFAASHDSRVGNFRQAIERRLRALALSKELSKNHSTDDYFTAEQYGALGFHYAIIGNYEEAIKYGLEAIRMSEESHDTTITFTLANRYNSLARTYNSMNQFEKALHYFRKAVEVGRPYRQYVKLSRMICNVSTCLLQLNRYDEALENLQTMSASFPPLDGFDSLYYERSYMEIYIAMDKIQDALSHFQKTASFYAQNEDYAVQVGISLIEYCIAARKYDDAQYYLHGSRRFYKKRNMAIDFNKSFELEFKLDSAQGDYLHAIRHYQRYKAIGDSLANKQRTQQISELEVIYETQKKDQNIRSLTQQAQLQQAISERKDRDLRLKEQDIALLSRERQLHDAHAARKDQDLNLLRQKQELQEAAANKKEQDLQTAMLIQNITIVGVVVLVILIGLLFSQYQIKQRSSRSISEKNEALKHLLREKEWLVKEVHHRVKNNLQTIVSLLESQSRYLDNDALNAIHDSQNRVHAMSLIHQKLYQHERDTSIDLSSYLLELVHHLQDSLRANPVIDFQVDIDPIELDVSQAVPVGLIVNEAITNSIKYAFRHTSQKHHEVSLHAQQLSDGKIVLTIADNGEGLPQNFDTQKSGGLGLKLIRGLAEDIEADLTLESSQGLTICLTFAPHASLAPSWSQRRLENTLV
jgi:two-component system, sensor histidine kinase PdtaS